MCLIQAREGPLSPFVRIEGSFFFSNCRLHPSFPRRTDFRRLSFFLLKNARNIYHPCPLMVSRSAPLLLIVIAHDPHFYVGVQRLFLPFFPDALVICNKLFPFLRRYLDFQFLARAVFFSSFIFPPHVNNGQFLPLDRPLSSQ